MVKLRPANEVAGTRLIHRPNPDMHRGISVLVTYQMVKQLYTQYALGIPSPSVRIPKELQVPFGIKPANGSVSIRCQVWENFNGNAHLVLAVGDTGDMYIFLQTAEYKP